MADSEGRMYFKLCFDAESLNWVLEEYMNSSEARVRYESFSA
jgi:hypothetical protein